MRIFCSIVVLICLSSCSSFLRLDEGQRSKQHHSSRRAHSSKYIAENSNLAGSRSLFVKPNGHDCLNSSKAVSDYLDSHHRERNRDAVFLLLLDEGNQVLAMEELLPASLNSPPLYISEVTQKASSLEATSVILVQCLPSRTSTPYSNDREISKNLLLALGELEIEFLDHLILGRNKCFSFADNQLL